MLLWIVHAARSKIWLAAMSHYVARALGGWLRLQRVFSASRKQYGVCPTWTLLVTRAKCAADVAKAHSWQSGRIHQSIGLVCTWVQMAEKNGSCNQQPAGKSNTVLMQVSLSEGESLFRALWQTASVWAVSIAFLVFTNSRDTTKNSLCLATTTRQKTIRQIWRERSTEREIREKQASASRIQIPPVKLCWAAVSPQCLSRHSWEYQEAHRSIQSGFKTLSYAVHPVASVFRPWCEYR